MKSISMNNHLKILSLILMLSVSFYPLSRAWASEEEQKHEEGKSKEGKNQEGKSQEGKGSEGESKSEDEKSDKKKGTEAKQAKAWSHFKPKVQEESHDEDETTSNGKKVLSQATGCLVDYAALEDIKRSKDELEERKKELTNKEADLKVREQAIAEELTHLEKVRDEITSIKEEKNKDKVARVAKLVETFLTMNPKSAAKVLSALEDSLAVMAMSQMDTNHLAKIMNNMEPARSSHLSELLAGLNKAKERASSKKKDEV